jgi:cell division protein FtsN
VALVAWGDHFLSPGPSGGIRRLLDLWATPRVQGQVGPVTPATAEPLPAPGDAAPRAAPADEPAPPPAAPAAASAGDSRAPAAVLSARAVPARLAARYSLDLGTFAVVEDAERAEAQLNQAGFSTVRFRQQEPVRLFTVTLASPPDPDETQAIVSRLREDGFAQTVMPEGAWGTDIRVAQAIPLRTAVRVAERLRSAGHEPRVWAEAARAGQVTLRHGTFTSREEAEAVGREISRLGMDNEVVQIR